VLAALAMTASGAVAAESKGQGCDVRGVQVPGCEPGTKVQPSGKKDPGGSHEPSNNLPEISHDGGGDKPHYTPKSK
jgi:hypothetical protein